MASFNSEADTASSPGGGSWRRDLASYLTPVSHASAPFITTFMLIHLTAPVMANLGGTSLSSQVMVGGISFCLLVTDRREALGQRILPNVHRREVPCSGPTHYSPRGEYCEEVAGTLGPAKTNIEYPQLDWVSSVPWVPAYSLPHASRLSFIAISTHIFRWSCGTGL